MNLERSKSLIFGVGINDVDLPVKLISTDGKQKIHPAYRSWHAALKRSYSKIWHDKYPTYIGCRVCPDWHRFSAFYEWYLAQDAMPSCQLDKDLLVKGNKIYSPSLCILVPQSLNKFLNDHGAKQGQWMIGVRRRKNGKYRAQCSNPFSGKRESLGDFPLEIDAHLAWKARKHELACLWAEEVSDPRLKQALRTRYLQ